MALEVGSGGLAGLLVVLLQHQQVIALPVSDALGDLLLRPHRIERDEGAFQLQRIQDVRDRRNLVRTLLDAPLRQHYGLLTGPSAHHLERRAPPAGVEGAAQRLPIDGDDLPVERVDARGRPRREAGLEGIGIDEAEDAAEGVMRGDPVLEAPEKRPSHAALLCP